MLVLSEGKQHVREKLEEPRRAHPCMKRLFGFWGRAAVSMQAKLLEYKVRGCEAEKTAAHVQREASSPTHLLLELKFTLLYRAKEPFPCL